MILTAVLWRDLFHQPMRHPLYQRIGYASASPIQVIQPRRPSAYASLGSVLLMIFLCSGAWLLICFLPLYFLLAGTGCGLIAALKISSAIVLEHEKKRHELLNITPPGSAGIDWMIGNLTVQKSREIRRLRLFAVYSYASMAITFILFFALGWFNGIYIFTSDGTSLNLLSVDMVNALIVLIVIGIGYLDLVGSTLVGILIGLVIATSVQDRIAARVMGAGSFLAVQMVYYASIGLIGIVVLGDLLSDLSLLIFFFIMFIGLRELLLQGLWRMLAQRHRVSPKELHLVVKGYS